MAFQDALQDVCTIQQVQKVTDSFGQEKKNFVNLFVNEPCRIHRTGFQNNSSGQGSFEESQNKWILMVKPSVNTAIAGDRVIAFGMNYTITRKQEIKGSLAAPNHIIYDLIEIE